MLKYGRNEKNDVCVLLVTNDIRSFGASMFSLVVPQSNCVVVSFLLTSLRKDYFLRRRLQRYRFLMAEIAVLLVLDIRLPAFGRISMRNRFVING